jgi:hypothetical protein
VDLAKGAVERKQAPRSANILRDRVRDGIDASKRLVNHPPDDAGRHALGGRMHGHDPARVDLVGVAAPKDLDRGVLHAEPAAEGSDLAGDRHLLSLAMSPRRPRLVEPGQVDVAGAVEHGHGDDGLPAPRVLATDPSHRPDERRLLPDPQITDLGHCRPIDVAPRVVMEEIADRLDVDRGQRLPVTLRPSAQ